MKFIPYESSETIGKHIGRRTDGLGLFPAGRVSVLFGPPKIGKTWSVQELGVQAVEDGARLWWCLFDGSADDVFARFEMLGLAPEEIAGDARLFVLDCLPKPRKVQSGDLVVIDPTDRALASLGLSSVVGDGTNTLYVDRLLRYVRREASVVLIDHLAVGGSGRPRGPGAKEDAADTTVEVGEVERVEVGGRGRLTLTARRSRGVQPSGAVLAEVVLVSEGEHGPMTVTFEPPEGSTQPSPRPEDAQPPDAPLENVEEAVLALLAAEAPLSGNQVRKRIPARDSEIIRVLARLVEDGRATSQPGPRRAQVFTLSEAGLTCARTRARTSPPLVPGTSGHKSSLVPGTSRTSAHLFPAPAPVRSHRHGSQPAGEASCLVRGKITELSAAVVTCSRDLFPSTTSARTTPLFRGGVGNEVGSWVDIDKVNAGDWVEVEGHRCLVCAAAIEATTALCLPCRSRGRVAVEWYGKHVDGAACQRCGREKAVNHGVLDSRGVEIPVCYYCRRLVTGRDPWHFGRGGLFDHKASREAMAWTVLLADDLPPIHLISDRLETRWEVLDGKPSPAGWAMALHHRAWRTPALPDLPGIEDVSNPGRQDLGVDPDLDRRVAAVLLTMTPETVFRFSQGLGLRVEPGPVDSSGSRWLGYAEPKR